MKQPIDGQNPIDIRPHTRYNKHNLIEIYAIITTHQKVNGSQINEFSGTEWLCPFVSKSNNLLTRSVLQRIISINLS